jgi:hypothetical protein
MPVFEWFNFMRDLLQDMSLHIGMNIEPSDDSLNWIVTLSQGRMHPGIIP